MKYLKTDFYNEWVEFEHDGHVHRASLSNSQDNGQKMEATFQFNNQEYELKKWLTLEKAGTTLNIEIKERR